MTASSEQPKGTTPEVSIIVIAHNVADELVRCLASIRNHAGSTTTEVLFIDNGSSDGSAELVADHFPDVRIVRRPTNEGMYARNHGLRQARGEYRMFLDSDAELSEGALPALVAVLESHPQVGLVGPRLVYPDGTLQLSTRRFPPLAQPLLRIPPLRRFCEDGPAMHRYLMADDAHDRQRRVEYVLGACQLFRGEAQTAVGEIDGRTWSHDDADWCFRIRRSGFDVVYVPSACVVHDYRRRASANPLSLFALRFLVAHLRFQRKWWRQRKSLSAEGRAMDREAAERCSFDE